MAGMTYTVSHVTGVTQVKLPNNVHTGEITHSFCPVLNYLTVFFHSSRPSACPACT